MAVNLRNNLPYQKKNKAVNFFNHISLSRVTIHLTKVSGNQQILIRLQLSPLMLQLPSRPHYLTFFIQDLSFI